MAQFQYVITDGKGIRREDRVRASNLDIAMQTLQKKGYIMCIPIDCAMPWVII